MQERVMRHYLSSLRNLSEFFLINFIDPLTSVDSKILKITDPIKLNLTSLLLINLTLKNTINKVVFMRYSDSFPSLDIHSEVVHRKIFEKTCRPKSLQENNLELTKRKSSISFKHAVLLTGQYSPTNTFVL